MFFRVVYKSTDLSSVLSGITRVTDGQTDRRKDGQTEFLSLDRVCITCSAVKTGSRYGTWTDPEGTAGGWGEKSFEGVEGGWVGNNRGGGVKNSPLPNRLAGSGWSGGRKRISMLFQVSKRHSIPLVEVFVTK